MKPGFLTLQRKFFDHWLWTEPRQFSRAEAWLDLLRSAAFADHSRIIRGSLVTVNRGEIVASLRYLGERWGWKKDKVNAFVRLLENATMIRRETRQQETVIILCNYDTYNIQTGVSSDSDPTQNQTENRQRTDSDPTKENKVNKGKKEIPPNPQGGFALEVSESQKQDPDQIAVGKLLGRRESTKWTSAEIKLLKAIKPIHPDDLAMMQRFYGAEIPKEADFRRTTVERLLKHWNGELDKARIYIATKP